MEKQFVISHLHGQIRTLERLLGMWKPKEETLIVLGDNNDYGPNSFLVYKRLLEVKDRFGERVVFLKGNHELLFEKFYANPSIYADEYFDNGGLATIASFYTEGLSYEELTDTYHLINEVLPKIDFDELTLYLSKCVPVMEAHYSVFVSKESFVFKNQLEKDWSLLSKKKFFFSLKNDAEFKLHYFSVFAKEEALLSGSQEAFYLGIKNESNSTKLGSISFINNEKIDNKELFKPCVSAYKIANGSIVEEINLKIEE